MVLLSIYYPLTGVAYKSVADKKSSVIPSLSRPCYKTIAMTALKYSN